MRNPDPRIHQTFSRAQSLFKGPPRLGPVENFQMRVLQLPGKCHFETILGNIIYIRKCLSYPTLSSNLYPFPTFLPCEGAFSDVIDSLIIESYYQCLQDWII